MAVKWKEAARSKSSGAFLKFSDGDDVIVKFIEGPEYREFSNDEGRLVKTWEWKVLTEEGEKTLSVASKRLLEALADEDDEAEILGRWIRIRCRGSGYQRMYRVSAAKKPDWAVKSKRLTETKAKKPKPEPEPVDEEEEESEESEEQGYDPLEEDEEF